MATEENSGQLTPKQIVRLAATIAADDMESIAFGYMDIGDGTIKNLQYDHKGQAQSFNREIIKHWSYKNPDDQIQVSSKIYH